MSEGNRSVQEPKKPLLFISHKHDDKAIADQIAKFVRRISGGRIDVFQSSNPGFEGPRVGKPLNIELKDALWRAGVVILVYTSQEKDWAWCMWECGLAEDPNSPDTKVIVLQCMQDKPQVFEGNVRVMAWDEESIQAFAKRFTERDFFPGYGSAVVGFRPGDPELIDAAKALHTDLLGAIPVEPTENWDAWPFLRIRLAKEVINQLQDVQVLNRVAKTREALLEKAIIVLSSSGASGIFGRSELPNGMVFGDLVEEWEEYYPSRSCGWVDVIARQVIDGARRRRPNLDAWERFRHVNSDYESVPGIGRIKSDSVAMQFDIYFYGVARVPTVVESMTPLARMYHQDLAVTVPKDIHLRQLLNDLEQQHWNRIPILDGQRPKYIVHVSVIDRFIREQTYAGQEVANLTLEDLLREPAMEKLFAETWGVVSRDMTVGDAQKTMRTMENCLDLFVTQSGSRDEPLLGWLTNRDIDRKLS